MNCNGALINFKSGGEIFPRVSGCVGSPIRAARPQLCQPNRVDRINYCYLETAFISSIIPLILPPKKLYQFSLPSLIIGRGNTNNLIAYVKKGLAGLKVRQTPG